MIDQRLLRYVYTPTLAIKANIGKLVLTAFFLLFLPGQNILAHHSAGMFDLTKKFESHATVKEFQWTYPHIWIQVNITNDKNIVEEWSIEGGVPSYLFRRGWRPNSFKPGDKITLRYHPMRDGGKAAWFIGAKFDDGKVLGKFE